MDNNNVRNNKKIFKLIIFLDIFLIFFLINKLLISKYDKKNVLKISKNKKFKNNETYIQLDNQFNLYEDNVDYSNYSTDIKVIALYLPQFYITKENDKWWGKNFTEWTMVRRAKPLFIGHHQPRIPGDEKKYLGYYYLTNSKIIKKQVKLAKSHGLYGFGFYYYWFSGKRLLKKPLDIFLENKDINFHFLLIWANENWTRNWNGGNKMLLIEQKYKKKDPLKFIKDIKKYIKDPRYIKINGKKVIGIYEPFKIPNLTETISIWRNKAIKYGIGKIYILICKNRYNRKKLLKLKKVDAAYDFPPRNNIIIKYKKKLFMLYSNLIYKWINFPNISNQFPIFGGAMIEWDNSPRRGINGNIFQGYSPEKFYLLNKIIIRWTRHNYNKTNRIIFVNAWNEWGEGTYLEPDEKYGYSSINALSKALFNLSYVNNYNISNLSNSCQIAIQVHVYYIDLIMTIIKKTNNIPVKFDLYISTSSLKSINNIKRKIKKFSNSNKFEIIYVENRGRDVYPFLKQLKSIFINYKYICHIHTKKSLFNSFPNFGKLWRNYLFNNLLGNRNIILEILSYFENYNNLGFIFPETYQEVFLSYGNILTYKDKKIMNDILKMLFPKKEFKIGTNIDFPEGNMFWAKTKSIHQIFNLAKEGYFPKEKGQNDGTMMHGIERIWLYIVKLNGFYYKKIFKHY